MPSPSGVAAALAAAVRAPAFRGRLVGRVVDAATGRVLFDRSGDRAVAPASTAKLLTAAALLTVRRPADRLTTRAVAGRGRGTVVLVGGGDPTLSGAPAGQAPAYRSAARLSDLAAAVRAAGPVRRIVVDGSLFAGPALSPAWAPEDVPSSYASAITAVMADGGRAAPDAPVRSAAPDLAAGRELAALLGDRGIPVVRGAAPPQARVLASVRSAPLAQLVTQTVMASDNVLAECLARQVALAEHRPATFTGSAEAIRAVLAAQGIRGGSALVDGSGLAASDRIRPSTVLAVLRYIAGYPSPGPAGPRAVVAALPVAGWSGSLTDRYITGPARGARGDVRAKTGTLTGVSALAGLVHDRSGRLLVFAFDAERVAPTATPAAEAALDVLAARLASCGCA
jgi:D-alanyl-D-alanine carboxypeptidase/D-alanyl-D-alanine-endopeptidase (penicillin-binding protein 4)